jgi:tripartite-type tricarboxylate transporter receptor subunit TctC
MCSKKLSDTLLAVLGKPEVREKIAGAGVDPDAQDAAALARTIDAEIRRWAQWVKDAGIQPE